MPILEKEVSIRAPLHAVWNAWTTEEGLAFLSPKSNIELRIDGPYEWFLDNEPDEQGKRGGEGSHVLAFLPQKMIAFSWTFPPAVAELRNADERTQVVVLFEESNDGAVQVSLHAHGWQDGEPWQRGWDYFDSAWGFVLDAMKQHLESR
ncbi:MAG: SRPBCC domain-containing protein [Gammaproteobacteria bacterium]|nr:SRPBCC domain-containing protein [Gammaproteobacteria bacterium]